MKAPRAKKEDDPYEDLEASWTVGDEFVYRRRRRRGAGTAGGGTIFISSTSFPAFSPIGTVVGNLVVLGGWGSYTFGLTSNPGLLFTIVGNQLQVNNASIAPGSYPVSIQADNGAGSTVTASFVLVALSSTIGQSMGLLLALTYAV